MYNPFAASGHTQTVSISCGWARLPPLAALLPDLQVTTAPVSYAQFFASGNCCFPKRDMAHVNTTTAGTESLQSAIVGYLCIPKTYLASLRRQAKSRPEASYVASFNPVLTPDFQELTA